MCIGALVYALFIHSWWVAFFSAIAFRSVWFALEHIAQSMMINSYYRKHIYEFKQLLGPYGIRLANQAEESPRTKKRLAEVFVPSLSKLRLAVDRLKVLDTLYQAGMTPDQDARLLHDCILKYGMHRLENHDKKTNR
jgi:hypothetical protein